MKFNELQKVIDTNFIAEDVDIQCEPHWEGDAADCNRVWYNEEKNKIILTCTTWDGTADPPLDVEFRGKEMQWRLLN